MSPAQLALSDQARTASSMSHFFEKRDRWGNSLSLWLILGAILIVPLCVWSLRQLRMENDIDHWLPSDDPNAITLKWSIKQFGLDAGYECEEIGLRVKAEVHRVALTRRAEWSASVNIVASAMTKTSGWRFRNRSGRTFTGLPRIQASGGATCYT